MQNQYFYKFLLWTERTYNEKTLSKDYKLYLLYNELVLQTSIFTVVENTNEYANVNILFKTSKGYSITLIPFIQDPYKITGFFC